MLIVEKKPQSAVAEFYRTLRTNIEYSTFDEKFKIILVTSAEINEGKTRICSNLALSFAEKHKKVLLMDCDFRNPSIYSLFNLSNECGLSDVLAESKTINEAIKSYNKNLDILPCGTNIYNPTNMIESQNMNNLMKNLRDLYDVIIIDSAPINVVTEPQILSTMADGTIIVIKKNVTKIDSVKEARARLEQVRANIIGCVFDGVERPKKKHNSYYIEEIVKA